MGDEEDPINGETPDDGLNGWGQVEMVVRRSSEALLSARFQLNSTCTRVEMGPCRISRCMTIPREVGEIRPNVGEITATNLDTGLSYKISPDSVGSYLPDYTPDPLDLNGGDLILFEALGGSLPAFSEVRSFPPRTEIHLAGVSDVPSTISRENDLEFTLRADAAGDNPLVVVQAIASGLTMACSFRLQEGQAAGVLPSAAIAELPSGTEVNSYTFETERIVLEDFGVNVRTVRPVYWPGSQENFSLVVE